MKKNILKATLVVAFALIAGMNVYNAQQSDVIIWASYILGRLR